MFQLAKRQKNHNCQDKRYSQWNKKSTLAEADMALNNLWKYLNLLFKNTFYTSLKYCNKPLHYHRQNNEWKTKQKVAEFKEEHVNHNKLNIKLWKWIFLGIRTFVQSKREGKNVNILWNTKSSIITIGIRC